MASVTILSYALGLSDTLASPTLTGIGLFIVFGIVLAQCGRDSKLEVIEVGNCA